MTFTPFDATILADTNNADYKLHYLKSFLNDKTAGKGPHPDGANFADEELNNFLTVSGGGINGAYIQACKALATSWSSFALSQSSKVGGFDAKDVADAWKERAEDAAKVPIDSATGQKFAFEVY